MYTCHVCVYAYIYIAQGNWNIYILVELSRLHEGTYPPSPSHIKVRHRQNQINFVNIISPFNTCIWTNLNLLSFTQGCFVPSLGEIGLVVLEKKMKMWKVYRQTDRQPGRQTTDDRRSEKLTLATSSGELKRQRNLILYQKRGSFINLLPR